jgi:hypothetical protein
VQARIVNLLEPQARSVDVEQVLTP